MNTPRKNSKITAPTATNHAPKPIARKNAKKPTKPITKKVPQLRDSFVTGKSQTKRKWYLMRYVPLFYS